ncbi:Uncharacterised protein [Mycobacteroides abscessus subsp. abscessus]|uniref:hypothetical protein n=1 Tax=Mycobacteroides abscessus TaxID=36809 RepID=UPI000928A643|nr:hypothetical protein [Mycobacteroides abscessus]MBN7532503.1 hypothetical protein [Mycobacteroides abscessus subsp. abscessus]MDO3086084.1 hypothetical protein [Mycobacteroides abscessus subsp. abscessus]MDO3105292.1 hypothetical protein [Mycobacteroides abscessus subsp. abscessus]PVA86477.1 hypothetical protein DDJ47_21275 [Mycobacteroides abscessus]RIT08766.1 hypothetical protein D2E74_04355 [Mycobacteroides abscessus]
MVPEGQPVGQPGLFERRGAAGKLATRLSVLATVVATFLFGMYWGFWRVAVVLIEAQGRANVDPDDYLDQIRTAGFWGNLCRLVGLLVVVLAVGLAADGLRKAPPAREFLARYALVAAAVIALGYVALWGFQLAAEIAG